MKKGLLWFDNDKKTTLEEKILRAAEYYKQKYGKDLQICMVYQNADLSSIKDGKIGNIVVKPDRSILPNHLWLEIE